MGTQLRVMTYNIHSCGANRQDTRINDVINAIKYADSDILAIQEIESRVIADTFQNQCEIIKEECNYDFSFAPTIEESKRSYGIALFIRSPLQMKDTKILALPGTPGSEPRVLLCGTIHVNDTPIRIINTHLGLRPAENRLQAHYIHETIQNLIEEKFPIIFTGDLNAIPGGKTLKMISKNLKRCRPGRSSATFPSFFPVLSLDHILTTKHFLHESTRVLRTPLYKRASDHLPLISDLHF